MKKVINDEDNVDDIGSNYGNQSQEDSNTTSDDDKGDNNKDKNDSNDDNTMNNMEMRIRIIYSWMMVIECKLARNIFLFQKVRKGFYRWEQLILLNLLPFLNLFTLYIIYSLTFV